MRPALIQPDEEEHYVTLATKQESHPSAIARPTAAIWQNRRLYTGLILLCFILLTLTVALVVEFVHGLEGWLVIVAALAVAWLLPVLVIAVREPARVAAARGRAGAAGEREPG